MTPEATQWLLEHATFAYEAEEETAAKVRELALSTLKFMIAPIFGVVAYWYSNSGGESFNGWSLWFFWVPLIFAALFLLAATYYVANVLGVVGFRAKDTWIYSKIPFPGEIQAYLEEHPDPEDALQGARSELLKEYVVSVEHNAQCNKQRSNRVGRAQGYVFWSLPFLVVCALQWGHDSVRATQESRVMQPFVVQPAPGVVNAIPNGK